MPITQRSTRLHAQASSPAAGADAWARRVSRSIARGDLAAFAELYDASFDTCVDLTRRLTRRDESFCLDVAQDALLKAARTLRPVPSAGDLDRWLIRVVQNTAIDQLRRERRRTDRHLRRGTLAHSATPPHDAGDEVAWMREQLASLDPDDLALITHRFGRSSTIEQAAAAEGVTAGAAHGRIRRTVHRLRDAAKELFP